MPTYLWDWISSKSDSISPYCKFKNLRCQTTYTTIPQRYQESSIKTLNIYINWQEEVFTWSMPQGDVTSVTLRSVQFNEGDEIYSSLRLTAERGHYSRHIVQCGSSLSKRILHKGEDRICFLKKRQNHGLGQRKRQGKSNGLWKPRVGSSAVQVQGINPLNLYFCWQVTIL